MQLGIMLLLQRFGNNIKKYETSTNYHMAMSSTSSDGTVISANYYEKNGKQAMILTRVQNNEPVTMSMYKNGDTVNTYWVTPTENKAKLNGQTDIFAEIYNVLSVDSEWQKIVASFTSFIGSTKYDGKDCYVTNNFLTPSILNNDEKNEYYIEKDTGLFIFSNIGNVVSKKIYEFDNVSDDIFVEPDISSFTISE